ncbi:MAG: mechanosensitive ion channel family protein [Methanobacterium sp.]|uniref:mechanosensitive ion channel family protein n=1 Tax=Methanobacterium sp. TaxID=2164 RepID=UPI003D65B7DD|nr:mechanosensitive ion channel family protein [Methanobacterium sp.]
MNIESLLGDPRFKDIIVIAVTLLGALLSIKWATYLLKKTHEKWDVDLTLIQASQEITKYSIYLIALIIILNELGYNLTAVVLSLGIFGIAIGFGARDTISNFISGLFILADKSIKVGDIVEISNQKGKVAKMGFRTTTLLTYDKRVIKVPNSIFSSSPYINYTASDLRRVDLNITLPNDIELDKTLKALEDMASQCQWALKTPQPKVIVKELSDVGVKLTLNIWINDAWKVAESKSNLAKEAKKLLKNMESKNN